MALTSSPGWLDDDFFDEADLANAAQALATMHDQSGRPFGHHRLVRSR
jgi:hypothetical protein